MLVATAAAFTFFSSATAAGAADTGAAAAPAATERSAAQPLSTSTPVVFVHGYAGSAANTSWRPPGSAGAPPVLASSSVTTARNH